jgi:hypothetical protein
MPSVDDRRATLVERMAALFREMATLEKLRSGPFTWDEMASAALDLALEEAAKVAETFLYGHEAAAAIRALKGNG